jgi:hypothetical protein
MREEIRSRDGRRSRRLRRLLLVAAIGYGAYGLWRTFPRFDRRLVGSWTIMDLSGPRTTITFFERGGGRRGNINGERRFRWWTCGNRLLMHPDRGGTSENVQEALAYALRTLLFLDRPHDLSEFDIVRLESSLAQFHKRPRRHESGVTESLVLER